MNRELRSSAWTSIQSRRISAGQQAVGALRTTQQRPHRSDHLGVVYQKGPADTALGREVELDRLPLQCHVFTQQGGDPERVVLLGVLLTACPEVAEVKKLQGQGENTIAVESALP